MSMNKAAILYDALSMEMVDPKQVSWLTDLYELADPQADVVRSLEQEIETLNSQVEILRVTCDAHISVIEDTEKERDEWKHKSKVIWDNRHRGHLYISNPKLHHKIESWFEEER